MPTPKTSPRSWTSALAVFATPDWRCSVASSRIPIVSVMPGRNVTSAASVTTSGDASRPSSTSARSGEARRNRRDAARPAAPCGRCGSREWRSRRRRARRRAAPAASPPAAAEDGRQRGAGERVGGEQQRPRALEAVGLESASAGERRARRRADRRSPPGRGRSSRAIASRSTVVGRTRSAYSAGWGSDPIEMSTSVGVAETWTSVEAERVRERQEPRSSSSAVE